MADTIARMGDTVLQHGPSSDRVYVMELAHDALPDVLEDLESLASQKGYGKVVVKARAADYGTFALRGYTLEALVPGFHGPSEPGAFMGKFLDPDRAAERSAGRVRDVLGAALERNGQAPSPDLPDGVTLREAAAADADALAACYDAVFESYPFPIHEPEHIRAALDEGTRFFVATAEDRLVAASSMEPGGAPGVVEMTDFATLPDQRGRGLATHLLRLMDRRAAAAGVRVAYTIARAASFGMNITFARRDYRYGGTLVNNTQISGDIESMNVWFKLLDIQGSATQ